MEITLNYNRTNEGMVLVGGQVTHQEELLFFTNRRPVLDKFLDITNITIEGIPTVELQGDKVSLTTPLDREFINKPFMNVEEIPIGLERIMLYMDNVSVEGYLEIQGRNIIIHYPSQELGQSKLKNLDE